LSIFFFFIILEKLEYFKSEIAASRGEIFGRCPQVKSFAIAHGEILGLCPRVKSNADAFGEIKSVPFTPKSGISPPKAISPTVGGFHPSEGRI